jgi:hypothetical protein
MYIGETYHEHRRRIMLARQEGLAATYNRFHDPDETGADIVRLRELHAAMAHGFDETPQGLRYTISEPARREVLARLLELNHARYAEEVKAGKGQVARGKSRGKKSKGESVEGGGQLGLFGG